MCKTCNQCFSDSEKTKLKSKGWSKEQIDFVEHTLVEDKIKELI